MLQDYNVLPITVLMEHEHVHFVKMQPHNIDDKYLSQQWSMDPQYGFLCINWVVGSHDIVVILQYVHLHSLHSHSSRPPLPPLTLLSISARFLRMHSFSFSSSSQSGWSQFIESVLYSLVCCFVQVSISISRLVNNSAQFSSVDPTPQSSY